VWLGRCPVARAIKASNITTRTAAANISTSFGMAQFPRLLAPGRSVRLTARWRSARHSARALLLPPGGCDSPGGHCRQGSTGCRQVHPGYMPPMLNATNAAGRQAKIAQTPLRRLGEPIEVAYARWYSIPASGLHKPETPGITYQPRFGRPSDSTKPESALMSSRVHPCTP
jgi:hypothetical protein